MSFDTDAFKSAFATQCATSSVESSHAWYLGPGVFAALAREKGDRKWTVIFYFDAREVKPRDEKSGEQHMARELQLYMLMGFNEKRGWESGILFV